jgi:predicted O-methyltransferase YrrM
LGFLNDVAIFVQNETGVPVSATFNNIEIRPDQKNLDLWIKNFKPLYDAGVRSCTLPHTHWMMTGQVKKNFPELFVKNTILREVSEARDIAKLAEAGFDYVNLDRVLMRDHDRIKELARVKTKYDVKFSLLANEGCLGGCPVMSEHFQFNNTRSSGPQYFSDPISRVSCPKWDVEDIALQLKTGNFPPWREDWVELLDIGIDTIKMHGRENVDRLYETMDIIRRFAKGDEILFDNFNDYINDTNLVERPINGWRKIIKTCKFDCWDCNFCDKVWKAKGNTNLPKVEKVAQALIDSVNHSVDIDVKGISSDRVKQLLNLIGSMSTNYLEIGVLNGSTFCSTIKGNTLNAYAVDNWKEQTQPLKDEFSVDGSKEEFISNVKKHKGDNKVKLFDCDMFQVDKSELPQIDFLFYDADHSYLATRNSVVYYKDVLQDECVIIFDDANFEGVVDGAREGIEDAGLTILYDKIIENDIEDDSQWWNGLYLVIIGK